MIIYECNEFVCETDTTKIYLLKIDNRNTTKDMKYVQS